MSSREWTSEDDNQLIFSLTERATVEECAWILNCSSEEIRVRACQLIQDGKLTLSESTCDKLKLSEHTCDDIHGNDDNYFPRIRKSRTRWIGIHGTPIPPKPTRNDWTQFRNYWMNRPNLDGFWLAARKIAAKMEGD